MGFVTGLFLMYTEDEEIAFWMLVQMVDKYNMGGLWDPTMRDVRKVCAVHTRLLQQFCPKIHAHLKAEGVSSPLYATSFFITGFTYCLPWPCVLRVWDVFLNEGFYVLQATAVALLHMHQREILSIGFEKLMRFLRFSHLSGKETADGRVSETPHVSHVELMKHVLEWIPKVRRASPQLGKDWEAEQSANQ